MPTKKIVRFLDGINDLNISPKLEEYLESVFSMMSKEDVKKMNDTFKSAISDVDKYMNNNKEIIEEYMKFRTSKAYEETPAYEIQKLLLEFQNNSGYYDVFSPNLKILSLSYQQYVKKLERANKAILEKFPQSRELYNQSSN